jgi:uncharacterized protein (TIGR00297 family)
MLVVHPHSRSSVLILWALVVSLTFGIAVWALRAATPIAALCGGMICLLVTAWTGWTDQMVLRSGLSPMMVLFVLTFAATRLGRARTVAAERFERNGQDEVLRDSSTAFDAKARRTSLRMTSSEEEEKRGRNAGQIVANLGAAGLAAVAGALWFDLFAKAGQLMVLAVLAEATADTVSSEIGAAFGGRPFLVTTFRRVEAGTDGAVSLVGTLAGVLGALVVVGVGVWAMGLTWRLGVGALVGGVVGLGFDSLLGATVERRGWLGNDWVNFLSTVCAGVVALGVLRVW